MLEVSNPFRDRAARRRADELRKLGGQHAPAHVRPESAEVEGWIDFERERRRLIENPDAAALPF